jgi:hypothetical protein
VIFEPGKNIHFSTYPPPTLIHLSHPFTITSTNIDTLIPSLYQCIETRSIEVFWLLSQPLPHLRFIIWSFRTSSREFLNPVINTSHHKQEIFLYEYLCIESFSPQKPAQQGTALRYYTPQTRSPFWLLNPASEHAHASLLPRLSWSWTVLLRSDTHRKPVTAVLLLFVTYLLTFTRI